MKKIIPMLCFLLPFTGWAQTPSFITDSLNNYISRGMAAWNIPGLALVIVHTGKVAVLKGYGVKDIRSKGAVDENTLFMIASNTKLFTATSLALLEYRNKLSLNDPVTRYFPQYRLYDANTTALVTIKDMLTHRIGTKTFQGDFTFWNTSLTRQEIMQRMQLLKPPQQFRQDYGYCNSCFLTAGEVIPKVTGSQWENFVHDSIVAPLQMSSTMVLSTGIAQKPNAALPYTTSYTGTLQQVPYDNWNNLAPAASIISNVHDLSHWLLMQLDSGRYNGKQVVPFAVLQKTRDVNIITRSRRSPAYPMHFQGYGLGLFAADYNGRQVYWHTGGAGGMVSNVCFVPEEDLGIAILTNNDNQNFFEALRYQILDAYLQVPYTDRSRQSLPGFERGLRSQLKIQFNTKPDLNATLDYMDNGEWLMQYNNIEYGIFSVAFSTKGDKVVSVTTKQNEFVEYDPYTFVKSVP